MDTIFSGKVIFLIFALSLLLFFLYFMTHAVIHGAVSGKRQAYVHRLTLIVSFSAIILVLSDMIYYKAVTEILVYEVAVAVFPMIIGIRSDVTWEDAMPYGFAVFGFSLMVVLLRLSVPKEIKWFFSLMSSLPSVVAVALTVTMHVDFLKMVSDKGHVLRASSVKARVASEIDVLYVSGLLLILILHLSAADKCHVFHGLVSMVCLAFMLLMFFCCHFRATSGRLFVFSRRRDRELNEMMDLCVNEVKENIKIDHNYRAIYERIVVYFENEKPYLDPDLNVEDVARRALCNRLYVSRAISLFSGRNFCQYVNYYRVKHAVRVFEDDKELKLQQWAELAGFKTVACFSMAFRLYMNESPGDWSRRLKGTVPRTRGKKMLMNGQ